MPVPENLDEVLFALARMNALQLVNRAAPKAKAEPKAQPKADGAFGQAILDEAKHQIKEDAAELKQEFGGQLLSAASTAAQINSYLANRFGTVENCCRRGIRVSPGPERLC